MVSQRHKIVCSFINYYDNLMHTLLLLLDSYDEVYLD